MTVCTLILNTNGHYISGESGVLKPSRLWYTSSCLQPAYIQDSYLECIFTTAGFIWPHDYTYTICKIYMLVLFFLLQELLPQDLLKYVHVTFAARSTYIRNDYGCKMNVHHVYCYKIRTTYIRNAYGCKIYVDHVYCYKIRTTYIRNIFLRNVSFVRNRRIDCIRLLWWWALPTKIR